MFYLCIFMLYKVALLYLLYIEIMLCITYIVICRKYIEIIFIYHTYYLLVCCLVSHLFSHIYI